MRIPKSASYNDNRKRYGDAELPCVICGKHVTKPIHWVECVNGGTDECVSPGTANTSDPGYMGEFPVGRDCLRQHPSLRPYVITR